MSHSPSLTPGSRRSRLAFAALATLALALSSSPVLAFTNWLANSSFESNSFSGWVVYGSRAVESTNGTYYNGGNPGGSNVLSHSGAYVGKTWGQFNNVDNYNGCYQDVPASADSVWSADAWALTHQQDLLSGGNEFWLEVSFRDTYNTILGTYTSQVLNTNTMVPNTWAHLTVTNEVGSTNLTAPYGTAVARCQVVFHQPGGYYPGGSAYFDDINLIRTSAPDPDITFPPTDQTKVVGQTATFTVVASGKSTLTYKWQKYGQDLSNGGRISGATSPTLTIANLTVDDMAYYTVVVTDNAGSLSQGVNLTVLDPGIITGPVSQKKVEGETATLTVVAGGATALAYKWQKDGNDLANGGTISGATSATLTLANLTVADSGNYTVVVSDNGGTVTSEAATLTVVSAAQASNLLLNRGFESGADAPWSRFNGGGLATTNNNYYQTTEPVRVYDGLYVSQTYGNGAGSWNGIFQDATASAGQAFAADGWFLMAAQDAITGTSEAWLEVQFLNDAGNTIGLYKSDYITASFPTNTWVNLKATNIIAFWGDYSVVGQAKYLVAPAGTAKVRYQVTFHAGTGGGSIWYDNMSLFLKSPVTLSAMVSGRNLNLSFPTQTGVTYEVLYKNDLGDGNWQVLSTVTGNGSVKTVSDPLGTAKRFYRVNTL